METEGYSTMDLKDLVARAVHMAVIRGLSKESDPKYRVGFILMCFLLGDFSQMKLLSFFLFCGS